MSLPEAEDLFNCIDDLGVIENLELIKLINEEFDVLQEEQAEVKKQEKTHFDLLENRKNNLPHQWQLLNSTKGAGVIDGEFDMVLIGMSGVGKVCLLEINLLYNFNQKHTHTHIYIYIYMHTHLILLSFYILT